MTAPSPAAHKYFASLSIPARTQWLAMAKADARNDDLPTDPRSIRNHAINDAYACHQGAG